MGGGGRGGDGGVRNLIRPINTDNGGWAGRNNNDDLLNLVYLLGWGSQGDKDLTTAARSGDGRSWEEMQRFRQNLATFLSLLASRRRARDTEQETRRGNPPSKGGRVIE